MILGWYAIVVALVGIGLWLRGSILDALSAMLFFTAFGGGAAFIVGGASIPPASFALLFVFAHLLLSAFRRSSHMRVGFVANRYLIFFCLFGAITAFILPKIFANAITVSPLSIPKKTDLFYSERLHYSKQNITTAIYLIGDVLAAVCATAAAADAKSRRRLVTIGLWLSWVHIGFGVLGAAFGRFGGSQIIHFFRNANYAELQQVQEGYSRIAGVFPETSAYAGYAFIWFTFMVELWLRDVRAWATGATAFGLGLMIMASTSSSGYLALAIYIFVLGARVLIAPYSFRLSKAIPIAFLVLMFITIALTAVALDPHLAGATFRLATNLTVGKVHTDSGRVRLYWNRTAFQALRATWGLGIGAGSFRSSSLLLAIIGSTGVVGLAAFTSHLVHLLRPLRRETYALPGARERAVAVAATWSAVAGLIPAFISAPSPVPGYLFVIFGGLALGWRYWPAPAPAVAARSGSARRTFAPGTARFA